MFDSENYERKRLLQHMKTCKSWMLKIGSEIREMVRNRHLTEDCMEWLNHAGEINGAAENPLQTWINNLECIIEKTQRKEEK